MARSQLLPQRDSTSSTCCAHLPRGNAALCAHHVPVFPWFSLAPKLGKILFSSDASVMSQICEILPVVCGRLCSLEAISIEAMNLN